MIFKKSVGIPTPFWILLFPSPRVNTLVLDFIFYFSIMTNNNKISLQICILIVGTLGVDKACSNRTADRYVCVVFRQGSNTFISLIQGHCFIRTIMLVTLCLPSFRTQQGYNFLGVRSRGRPHFIHCTLIFCVFSASLASFHPSGAQNF